MRVAYFSCGLIARYQVKVDFEERITQQNHDHDKRLHLVTVFHRKKYEETSMNITPDDDRSRNQDVQNVFVEAVKKLTDHVVDREDKWFGRQKHYSRINSLLVGLSLVLSGSVTIAGMFNKGIVAAVFGVILAAVLGAQQAWPLSEKSFFYRVGKSEAFALKLKLEKRLLDQAGLDDIRAKFGALNTRMAAEIPRGTAVHDVIQTMREDVKSASADTD